MNDIVNDFDQVQTYRDDYLQLGSSEDFRQTGRGMAGVSTSEVGSSYGSIGRRGGRRDNYLTPRERDIRQQQMDRDEMYQDQRYDRSSRDFRKGRRSEMRVDRYQERNGRSRWEGIPSSDDFRQGAPSSINPRRQMQRSRNVRGGDEYYDYYDDEVDDEYYMDDVRYNEGRRKRPMTNDGYGYDDYYDPEIIGRKDRGEYNQKRSVWDNIRDVFKF
jgi:hypothetical protein